MRKSRFTEEQIAAALRQSETGVPVSEVIRKLGVSEQTFYRWKRKYAGMGVAELRKMKQLEEENRRLKQLVADLSLDKAMLQDVVRKNSKACRQTRGGGAFAADLAGQRALRLRRAAVLPGQPPLHEHRARAGRSSPAHPGSGVGPGQLRLPARSSCT